MNAPVARKLTDRVVTAWGILWIVLVLGVLSGLWMASVPIERPVPVVMVFVGICLSSFLVNPVSRVDATLTIGVGPAMFFLLYTSTSPELALTLWSTAWLVGTITRVRHIGDGAEAAAYEIGSALVAALGLHFINLSNTPVWAAAAVCVSLFITARVLISMIRLPIVATISFGGAVHALLPRRILLFAAGLIVLATAAHALQQIIRQSSPSIGTVGAGAVTIVLLGAATFAYAMFQESKTLSTRLHGTVEAALALPWGSNEPIEEQALAFAQRILPRYALELREAPQRNINEIVARIDGGYLVARRGGSQPPFFIQDQQVLESITHLATTMAAAQREHDRLATAASTDELTGLPNYRGFYERLEEFDVPGGVAVAYLDVNNFKTINDTYGHEAGNTVLRTLARRMGSRISQTDIAARVGGDEFVIVGTGFASEAQAREKIGAIFTSITTPIEIADRLVSVTLSYGLAFAESIHTDITALVTAADNRMYDGRSRIRVEERSGSDSDEEASTNLDSLSQMIQNCAVTFAYQPIVDEVAGRIIGVEALIRPGEGQNQEFTADVIVNEARRLGRLQELSVHMLRSTVADLLRFQQIAPGLRDLHVNIDVEQAVQGEFLETLTNHACPEAVTVTLELGEMSLHRVTEEIVAELRRLRNDHGVLVALDDFGRNSSTLRAIADYPLDVLKVDKSMIHEMTDPTTQLIVSTLSDMCEKLDVRMIVEGVERPEACEELVAVGVRNMQGYLFGAPATAEEFRRRLSTHGLRAKVG